eukprot:6981313-Ditylum_brightwellii.AAC.1
MSFAIVDPDGGKIEVYKNSVEALVIAIGTLNGLTVGVVIFLSYLELTLGFKGVITVLVTVVPLDRSLLVTWQEP